MPVVVNNKETLLNTFHAMRRLHLEVPFGSANPDPKTSPDSKEAGTPVMSVKRESQGCGHTPGPSVSRGAWWPAALPGTGMQ